MERTLSWRSLLLLTRSHPPPFLVDRKHHSSPGFPSPFLLYSAGASRSLVRDVFAWLVNVHLCRTSGHYRSLAMGNNVGTDLPLPNPQILLHPVLLLLPSVPPSLKLVSTVSCAWNRYPNKRPRFANLCAHLPFLHLPPLPSAVLTPAPTTLLKAFPSLPLPQDRKPEIVTVSCLPSSYSIVAPSPF